VCPFYDQCFYVHLNEDGTPAPVIPKPPKALRSPRSPFFDILWEFEIPSFWEFDNADDSSEEISDFEINFEWFFAADDDSSQSA